MSFIHHSEKPLRLRDLEDRDPERYATDRGCKPQMKPGGTAAGRSLAGVSGEQGPWNVCGPSTIDLTELLAVDQSCGHAVKLCELGAKGMRAAWPCR
jgi:hypothetical protein